MTVTVTATVVMVAEKVVMVAEMVEGVEGGVAEERWRKYRSMKGICCMCLHQRTVGG